MIFIDIILVVSITSMSIWTLHAMSMRFMDMLHRIESRILSQLDERDDDPADWWKNGGER